jgi:hypothetical protein
MRFALTVGAPAEDEWTAENNQGAEMFAKHGATKVRIFDFSRYALLLQRGYGDSRRLRQSHAQTKHHPLDSTKE